MPVLSPKAVSVAPKALRRNVRYTFESRWLLGAKLRA